ncbi:hypothetical protein I3843_04G136900 [Carya illinoinensis]|nr:hypothetical protein I3843_04G136900 [Carya illinoinensis]
MNVLSRMLEVVVDGGFISGFLVGGSPHGSLSVSHLLFADDMLIFCDPDLDYICSLRALLLCFEVVFGLKVNLSKSEVVPIGMVNNLSEVATILGCKVSSLPTRYLGLPLWAPHKSMIMWERIIEKIEGKLAGWKRIYLSKGERITLIKSTLSNFPMYFFSLFPLPEGVADRLEKIFCDFLWGGLEDAKKFHLIKWDKVCTPLSCSGLGLRKLRTFSKAALGKWLWRYHHEGDACWRNILDVKYESIGGGWCSKDIRGVYGMGVWKFIRNGCGDFLNN